MKIIIKSMFFLSIISTVVQAVNSKEDSLAIQKKERERAARLKLSVDKIIVLVNAIAKNSLNASKSFKNSKLIRDGNVIPSIMYLSNANITIDEKHKLFPQALLLTPYFDMMDDFETIKKILTDEILKEEFNISSFFSK